MSYDKDRYWTELHREHADSLSAVGYPEMGHGFNQVTYALRIASAERILRRADCAPRTLLEGAVGVGAYEPLWTKLGVERWVGLDLSEEAIERLRGRFPTGTFVRIDLTAGKDILRDLLAGEKFDLVTAIDVLYHIVDDSEFRTALTALSERVTSGGFLLLSDVFTQRRASVATHVVRRPLKLYQDVLAAHGFALVDRESVFAVLGDPVMRRGFHPVDVAMAATWRVLSKSVRSAPQLTRELVGRLAAQTMRPVDLALRRIGWARGVNLELGLFRRRTDYPRT